MGFFVTTLIFVVIGVIASLLARICCNRGPSANLYLLSVYACCFSAILKHPKVAPDIDYYCNSMLLDDVGYRVCSTDETTYRSCSERRIIAQQQGLFGFL